MIIDRWLLARRVDICDISLDFVIIMRSIFVTLLLLWQPVTSRINDEERLLHCKVILWILKTDVTVVPVQITIFLLLNFLCWIHLITFWSLNYNSFICLIINSWLLPYTGQHYDWNRTNCINYQGDPILMVGHDIWQYLRLSMVFVEFTKIKDGPRWLTGCSYRYI